MDVSIIIVNYNTKQLLADCIKTVYEQTVGITFEVIVSDNGSKDGSIEMLKDDWVNVRIYAVTSLGKLGDKKAVPALIEVMKNIQENDLVRAGAAAALGVLRDQRALLRYVN